MGGQTLQHPLLCAIFKAYLEEEKDIADMNVLAEVAEGVGMMSRDQVCYTAGLQSFPLLTRLPR